MKLKHIDIEAGVHNKLKVLAAIRQITLSKLIDQILEDYIKLTNSKNSKHG